MSQVSTSASEIWVNEAPPGGTVSNTYTSSLIRGRGGRKLGGVLRWARATSKVWKCGRVHLIRQNDLGTRLNSKSLGRWTEMNSGGGLELSSAGMWMWLFMRWQNKMDLLLLGAVLKKNKNKLKLCLDKKTGWAKHHSEGPTGAYSLQHTPPLCICVLFLH